MPKQRLDHALVSRGLVTSRSQAESYIKLGKVQVNRQALRKTGSLVNDSDDIVVDVPEQYVSRAALKLASVAELFDLNFTDQIVLDVGSSTGGFTDYALRHGAKLVIAVDVGTEQLHPSLRHDPRIVLHEKTDIRSVSLVANTDKNQRFTPLVQLQTVPNIVLADVSFIALREILPSVARLCDSGTVLVVMMKPQFEATRETIKHHGVIKNDRLRREVIKQFESWLQGRFLIIDKADSGVSGAKGNQERFYVLKTLADAHVNTSHS